MSRPARRVRAKPAPPPAAAGSATATEIKTIGWRGVLDRARRNAGLLTITNHDQPQAVILTPEAYASLLEKANAQDSAVARSLEQLRESFDARLASLATPKAAEQLREVFDRPARLHGKVKAGTGH